MADTPFDCLCMLRPSLSPSLSPPTHSHSPSHTWPHPLQVGVYMYHGRMRVIQEATFAFVLTCTRTLYMYMYNVCRGEHTCTCTCIYTHIYMYMYMYVSVSWKLLPISLLFVHVYMYISRIYIVCTIYIQFSSFHNDIHEHKYIVPLKMSCILCICIYMYMYMYIIHVYIWLKNIRLCGDLEVYNMTALIVCASPSVNFKYTCGLFVVQD